MTLLFIWNIRHSQSRLYWLPHSPSTVDDNPDVFESMDKLLPAAEDFTQSLRNVMGLLGEAMNGIDGTAQMTGRMARVHHQLDIPLSQLATATASLTSAWKNSTGPLRELTREPTMRGTISTVSLREQLIDLAARLDIPNKDQMIALLNVLGPNVANVASINVHDR